MKIMRGFSVFSDGAVFWDMENTHQAVNAARLRTHPATTSKEINMWNKPEYTEMRFGFEVTMYIANR